MGQSIFLAQILGPLLVVVGISLIFNEKHFKKMMKEMTHESLVMYLSGIIGLILGLYVLLTVKNDGYLYQSLLIFLGFAATVKGILLIIFPKYMKKVTKDFSFLTQFLQYFGFAYIILGMYFCFVGY